MRTRLLASLALGAALLPGCTQAPDAKTSPKDAKAPDAKTPDEPKTPDAKAPEQPKATDVKTPEPERPLPPT